VLVKNSYARDAADRLADRIDHSRAARFRKIGDTFYDRMAHGYSGGIDIAIILSPNFDPLWQKINTLLCLSCRQPSFQGRISAG
jgi:hypothetical protein